MRRSGFSLIELLVAAVLLVSMLVPIFSSLHTGIQGTERVSEESIAANHAVALLERLANVPYRRLPEIPPDTPESELATYVSLPGGPPPALAGSAFRRYVTVKQVAVRTENPTEPDNSEAGNLKRIEVSVKWKPDYLDRKSERTLTFRTLVTDDREVF